MTSLRRRLLLGLGLGLAICILCATWVFDRRAREELERDFDRDLTRRARSLAASLVAEIRPEQLERVNHLGAAALAESQAGGSTAQRERLRALLPQAVQLRLAMDASRLQEYEAGPRAEFFSIWRGAAEIARSASLGAGHSLRAPTGSGATDQPLPDGRTGRVLGLEGAAAAFGQAQWNEALAALFPGGLPEVLGTRVCVARGREELDERLAALKAVFLGVGALLALGMALATLWAVRAALRPLSLLRERVALLAQGDPRERVPQVGLPAEIQPLTEALNRALGALEQAFERERRIGAHVAHELRTPVAELRMAAEMALRVPGDTAALALLATQSLEIAEQMERVVGAVLRAARAGSQPAPAQDFDLGEQWTPVLERARRRAAERGVHLDLHGSPGLVHADPDLVLTVLGVLLENAADHAPSGTRISLRGERNPSTVQIYLDNEAPELEPQDLERLGEPFWRKQAARTPSDHLGLGLTLACSLARAGTLGLGFTLEKGRLVAQLSLPAGAMSR